MPHMPGTAGHFMATSDTSQRHQVGPQAAKRCRKNKCLAQNSLI